MNKNRLIINSLISIFLVVVLMLGSTYSIFTTSEIDEEMNVYTTGNLDVTYTLSSDNLTLTNNTPINDEEANYIEPYRITITNNGNVPYMFNVVLNDTTAGNVIDYKYLMIQVGKTEIKKLSEYTDKIIRKDVIVPANASVDVDVRIWISNQVTSSEMGKSFYAKLSIDGLAIVEANEQVDNSILIADVKMLENKPNLDNGLIPVYYDLDTNKWRKADSNNTNNNWYSYENKMWANAILISDNKKRNTYLESSVNTVIDNNDITAFYVWIPRFKYRVFNINRQASNKEGYSYDALNKGIEIKFERGISNTGNVNCVYNDMIGESISNLADSCLYDESDAIVTSSNNLNYKNAWYTHPAFTFGNKEIEGFWIGKFETRGSKEKPIILPNISSLNCEVCDTNYSTNFTISKIFQNYGLSNEVDAHMLTNLEWGAVSYLTNSKYGLCDNTGCRTTYPNNSSKYYTGRSSGDDISNIVNNYGNYDYIGYKLDEFGNQTNSRDISKVASSTRNITGVYDLVGSYVEQVMGNMLNKEGEFNTLSAGKNWDNNNVLNRKYYNTYLYGISALEQVGFNRSILGDATSEVVDIDLKQNEFVTNAKPWFYRSTGINDIEKKDKNNIYRFRSSNGVLNYSTFRSSIS